jgi:beta-mannosidase
MEHHQRSHTGNGIIISSMAAWFLMPKDFESALWLSQLQQGMAMKYACEHWRRSRPRCMGALYWQLNDCWPVASWSSIDSRGRRKALHYMARHFFAPVLVSGLEDDAGRVQVFVTNDRRAALRARVGWRVTSAGGQTMEHGTQVVSTRAGTSRRVLTLDLRPALERRGANDLLVFLELRRGRQLLSQNLVLLCRPKHLKLELPRITTQIQQVGDEFQVTLRSAVPTLWAWLELSRGDARYSDNFVHLPPNQPVRIRVAPSKPLRLAQFAQRLRVRHLGSTH